MEEKIKRKYSDFELNTLSKYTRVKLGLAIMCSLFIGIIIGFIMGYL